MKSIMALDVAAKQGTLAYVIATAQVTSNILCHAATNVAFGIPNKIGKKDDLHDKQSTRTKPMSEVNYGISGGHPCLCDCHSEGMCVMHCRPCCDKCYDTYTPQIWAEAQYADQVIREYLAGGSIKERIKQIQASTLTDKDTDE